MVTDLMKENKIIVTVSIAYYDIFGDRQLLQCEALILLS